jgi:hypothetical protein
MERDYQQFQLLDLHLWSDHPKVNQFVQDVYKNHFGIKRTTSQNSKKRNLKLILLNLLSAWVDDPNLNIAVHMSSTAYNDGTFCSKGRSRYNELKISGTIIEVVNFLKDARLIGRKETWLGAGGKGFVNLIWPTDELIKMFSSYALGASNISYHPDREPIVLLNRSQQTVEYQDNKRIQKMRLFMQEYNSLLARTFIDISSVSRVLKVPTKNLQNTKLNNQISISNRNKFVKRVFVNNRFSGNGVFAGGWWQQVEIALRKEIRIDDFPTVEIDFSNLYPFLAYAHAGLNFWDSNYTDIYKVRDNHASNKEFFQDMAKLLFIISLDASNQKTILQNVKTNLRAVGRTEICSGGMLSEIMDDIKHNASEISHLFCSGAGLKLCNLESRIYDYMLANFIETDTPLLAVNHSVIVPEGQKGRAIILLEDILQEIIVEYGGKFKYDPLILRQIPHRETTTKSSWFLGFFSSKRTATREYQERLDQHQKIYSNQ